MKKLNKVFKAGVVAVGVVTAGAAGATCDSNGNCWPTPTSGNSSASAAATGGAGGNATGGNAVVNNNAGTKWGPFLAAGLLGSLWGSNHSAPVAASGDWLHKSLGTDGFDFWLYSGRNAKGTEFDQEAANFLGAVEAAKMIPLGPKHAVIGYEALGNVSPAVKAALESATAPQGAENRSALIGYFNTEASGAAAPVATLPAADGAGFCNVYLGAVAPSYRVDGKVVQRRVGTGSRGKVAPSVTSSAPAVCSPNP